MAFKHSDIYKDDKLRSVREYIYCPNPDCTKSFLKRQYNHSYCSDKCKYEYYDHIDPKFEDHYPPDMRQGNRNSNKPKEYSIKTSLL